MIIISYNRYTIEAKDYEDAMKAIHNQKVPLQEAVIKFKASVPGIAFEELVQEIQSIGGKVQ